MENNKTNQKPWGIDLNTFCLLMHLSLLFFWPLSIVMWVTNKDNNEVIDSHGKNLANFLISYTIYYFVSYLLMFLLIGILTIFMVVALFIIFTIIAAIKAGKGEIYKYPLTIEIIK
jgi:hypothetical protein